VSLESIKTVAVLGAGTMGNGIGACVCSGGIQRDFGRDVQERLSAAGDGGHRQEPGPRGEEREVDGGGKKPQVLVAA